METLPQELLEMIISESNNLRNVRQTSKTLRDKLGGPLGSLTEISNPDIFSNVSKYLSSEDIYNLRLASIGGYNLTIKEWQRLIDQSVKNVEEKMIKLPINASQSFGVKTRDIKIFELLKLLNWKSKKFVELSKYVFNKYKLEIRNFVYLAVKEGILDIVRFIEKNNLYKNKLISDDSGENLLFFAIFHLLNETDSTKINKLMEMIAELFKFGFNPAYKPYGSFKNAYDLLGKENAESLFGPETNYPKDSYALENSRLDKL
jgi:hypothetical protein